MFLLLYLLVASEFLSRAAGRKEILQKSLTVKKIYNTLSKNMSSLTKH